MTKDENGARHAVGLRNDVAGLGYKCQKDSKEANGNGLRGTQ